MPTVQIYENDNQSRLFDGQLSLTFDRRNYNFNTMPKLIKTIAIIAGILLWAILSHQFSDGNLERDYKDLKPIIAEKTRWANYAEREADEMKLVHSAAALLVVRNKMPWVLGGEK